MKYFGRRRSMAAKVVTGLLVTSLFGASFYVPERFAVHAEEFDEFDENEEGLTEEEKELRRLKRLEAEALKKKQEEEAEETIETEASGDDADTDNPEESDTEDTTSETEVSEVEETTAEDPVSQEAPLDSEVEETVSSETEDKKADEGPNPSAADTSEENDSDDEASSLKAEEETTPETDESTDDTSMKPEDGEAKDDEGKDDVKINEEETEADATNENAPKNQAKEKTNLLTEKMMMRKAAFKATGSRINKNAGSKEIPVRSASDDYITANTIIIEMNESIDALKNQYSDTAQVDWEFVGANASDAAEYLEIVNETINANGNAEVKIVPRAGKYLSGSDDTFEVRATVTWGALSKSETYDNVSFTVYADADIPLFSNTDLTGSVKWLTGLFPETMTTQAEYWAIDPDATMMRLEAGDSGNACSGIKEVRIICVEQTSGKSETKMMYHAGANGSKELFEISTKELLGYKIQNIEVEDNAGNTGGPDYTFNPIICVDGVLHDELFQYEIEASGRSFSSTDDGVENGNKVWYSKERHGDTVLLSFKDTGVLPDERKAQSIVPGSFSFKQVSPNAPVNAIKPVKKGWNVLKVGAVLSEEEWKGAYEISTDEEGEFRYELTYDFMSVNGTETLKRQVYLNVDNTKPEIDISYGHLGEDFEEPVYTNQPVSLIVSFIDQHLDYDGLNGNKGVGIILCEETESGETEHEITSKNSNEDFGATWQRGENGCVLTLKLEADGRYRIKDAFATDRAENQADTPDNIDKLFVIDTVEPLIDLQFDIKDPVAMNFFNKSRTATITVEDRNINPDEVMIEIETEDIDGNHNTLNPEKSVWSPLGEDRHVRTVSFVEDGKYSLSVSATDLAGNVAEPKVEGEFIIDTTGPEITVYFDNNSAKNGIYYKDMRNATVSIKDFGVDQSSLAVTTVSGEGISETPYMEGFRSEGNTQNARIAFKEDGKYGFSLRCKDYAGNASDVYSVASFVIDMTEPEIHFDRVENYSANKGDVAPVIHYQDVNIAEESCVVTVSGANRGVVDMDFSEKEIANGKSFTFENVPSKKKFDDLYTMTAIMEDLAGNTKEETLVFSVNRFGSVYVISEETKSMMAMDYVKEPGAVSITEINVDTLIRKDVTVSRDGDAERLAVGKDYTIRAQGTDETWKSFTYTVPGSYFVDDGRYAVTVASVDRATNAQDNRSRNASIDFTVDRTAPSIVVSELEDGGRYEADSHMFMVNVTDNMALRDLRVYRNDVLQSVFDSVVLRKTNGTQEIEIPAMEDEVSVRLVSSDEAGNVRELAFNDIRVTAVTPAAESDEANVITDEETPLASDPIKSSVQWWWLVLILIMVTGTGCVYYAKNRQKKEN